MFQDSSERSYSHYLLIHLLIIVYFIFCFCLSIIMFVLFRESSKCYLSLPGGGCDFLSVAHVTDDIIEFIPPREITETHIIINISGFSAYGDVKDEDSPIVPIRALVLLFYKPPVVPKKRSILNVLLLPSNVVRKEVSWNPTTLETHLYLSGIQSNTQWEM